MKHGKRHDVIISILVVFFCLAGVLGSAYLFYKSLNAAITRADAPLKGKISWKNHTVQRRFSDRLIWNGMAHGSPIYDGDLIRTDDLAQAAIILTTGTTIDMQENCLIQITTDKRGRLNLQFLGGDIAVKTENETVFINKGDKQLEIKSNSMVRAVSENGNNGISITVDSGDATLLRGSIKNEISSGTSLSVDSNGTIRDEKTITIQNVSAPVQQVQTEDGTKLVKLEWKSNGEKVRLDVSSDNRFSNITYSRIHDTNNASVSLPPGMWWWRVVPVDARDSGSAEGKVIVSYVETPKKIIEPVASPVVFNFLTETTPVSTIREINRAQARQEEPSLRRPPPAVSAPPPSSPQPPAPLPQQETMPQPPAPKPLPAPDLLEPDTNLDPDSLKTNKNVTFSWTSVPDAKAYIWSLQNGATQTSVIVIETSFIYDASKISNGTYTWRVEALRTVPATNNVTERGEAAERQWIVNIPLPKKPVLLEPVQDTKE